MSRLGRAGFPSRPVATGRIPSSRISFREIKRLTATSFMHPTFKCCRNDWMLSHAQAAGSERPALPGSKVPPATCPEEGQLFPGNKTKLLPAAGVCHCIDWPETRMWGHVDGLVSGAGVGAGFLALALLNHNCGWPQVIREPFMQSCKPPGAGFTPREQTEKVTSYAYPKKS